MGPQITFPILTSMLKKIIFHRWLHLDSEAQFGVHSQMLCTTTINRLQAYMLQSQFSTRSPILVPENYAVLSIQSCQSLVSSQQSKLLQHCYESVF